jgi:hypothetical protein
MSEKQSPQDLEILGAVWLRGLDLNQRPLGYESIAGLHALQRATARRRENAQLAPSTLAPAGRRWWQFSGRNPVADRPSALARSARSTSGGAIAPAMALPSRDIISHSQTLAPQEPLPQPRRTGSWRSTASRSSPDNERRTLRVSRKARMCWSGRPDSNRRRPAWEAGILHSITAACTPPYCSRYPGSKHAI